MKIKLEVTITVPDDYGAINEPDWFLEDAIKGDFDYSTRIL